MASEEESSTPVDVKSRIATYSQLGGNSRDARVTNSDATTKISLTPPKPPKPLAVRKTPSTSQLLPAWQQKQPDEFNANDDKDSSLRATALTAQQRASTNDSNLGPSNGDVDNPSQLGVKNIIALYGQQGGSSLDSSVAARPRGSIGSADRIRHDINESGNPHLSARDVSKAPPPPPILPPRPKMGNSVSQSNTGSSNHSTSSTGNSVNLTSQMSKSEGGIAQSPYVPYVRKGVASESQSPAGSGAESYKSSVPALPPRSSIAARSTDDLSLIKKEANGSSTGLKRQLGSGAKWASSSSSQISRGSDHSMTPPAVPPRTTPASTSATPNSTLIPPPKRGITSLAAPASPKVNQNLRPSSASIQNRGLGTISPSSNGHSSYAHRSTLSSTSVATPTLSPSSGVVAPPPRHVDIRRMGITQNALQTSSDRRARKKGRRAAIEKRRQKRMTLQYSRDPGDAEERYSNLFDTKLQGRNSKQTEKHDDTNEALLEKKEVVRIWRRSRLEDWYLAKVWDAASNAEGRGVNKEAFIRAMSAIDYELARRRNGIKDAQSQQ